jgi:transcriptional regulator with XRE-family HTH domain
MNRLRQAREAKGWTQDELADKAKVSRATISSLENDRASCVKTDTLTKLADALESKVSLLFF